MAVSSSEREGRRKLESNVFTFLFHIRASLQKQSLVIAISLYQRQLTKHWTLFPKITVSVSLQLRSCRSCIGII